MKTVSFLLFSLVAVLSYGGEAPAYLLVVRESTDPRITNRVKTWMESNLHYEVSVQSFGGWEGETGKEQLDILLDRVEKPGIVTVVLSNGLLPEGQHAYVDPERKAGVVNVELLVPVVEEKTLRRLDRQAMRVVGFSLGIPPQPIPMCALYPYRSMEELDQIGRGFSPPAQALYRSQLTEHGIPLSEDAKLKLPNVNIRIPAPTPAAQEK